MELGLRVAAVCLGSAFVAFLPVLSGCGMNNLRVLIGADGSIPTAPTRSPVESVGLTCQDPLIS